MSNCQNGTHCLYITVCGCWIRYVWLFLERWLRLDREKKKKKEELKKVQESYRPQNPHRITLEQLPLRATDPNTLETLQDRQALQSLPQIGLAHHQNRQTSNSFKLSGKQDRCITKLTRKTQKNALHVVMCKYYLSYMMIIYATSSKQASSTWRMMMYLYIYKFI